MKKTVLYPHYKMLNGDLDTPVSVYLKLGKEPSFLLESVTGGEHVARYSFIGFDPFCEYIYDGDSATIIRDGQKQTVSGNGIDMLRDIVQAYSMEEYPDLPPFIGGAVGYFCWEIMSKIETMHFAEKDGVLCPDGHFMFPRSMVIFDHAKRRIIVLSLSESEHDDQAAKRLDEIASAIQQPMSLTYLEHTDSIEDPFSYVQSNLSEEAFKACIEKVKSYIYEGDIFQLVFSQRFTFQSKKTPFDIYRTLRYVNPSPYMFYMNFGDYKLVGASPEILVRLQQGKATLRPLAGTRKRIIGEEEALSKDLLSDEKEVAEHIMLVDLGRNDLGRVCDYDSVKTTELMSIEKYSHVLHIVSNVVGTLQKGKDAFDLFKATFPAGTLSGAPKIRAMEIIEELETVRRGPYGGALGYFDFRGNMDLSIIIRTLLSKNGQYYMQAGAGIVADSDPSSEYQESLNKARGLILSALEG